MYFAKKSLFTWINKNPPPLGGGFFIVKATLLPASREPVGKLAFDGSYGAVFLEKESESVSLKKIPSSPTWATVI